MKNIVYIVLLCVFITACDEEKWLEEEVFSAYTSDNSYSTPQLIDIAVVQLYRNISDIRYGDINTGSTFAFQYTTDCGYNSLNLNSNLNGWGDSIVPENGQVEHFWEKYFKIIYNANVILNRIDAVEYTSEAERNIKIGEAKFFRAYAYRSLVILYGGVPLVLEEITSPKRDFVRASAEAVWEQIIDDLTDATQLLPEADDVEQDGRIAKGVAYHALSEAYIVVEDYPKAIAAASEVIDNLGYELMKVRFGTRSTEPGDVYWDLFRRGNQNRGSGNTEAIYVSQYEFLTPGGEINDLLPRFSLAQYWRLTGNDGVNLFTGPTKRNGGRGIAWWSPSNYVIDQIWENSPGDIRNSEYNVIRDLVVDNPASSYFGQNMVESGALDGVNIPFGRRWPGAIFAKCTPIDNFPEEVVDNQANNSHRDRYVMRLAETYLLRAEAYLLNGNPDAAANDINELRARSSAPLITGGDVTMEFILDERARELFVEEERLLTLMRTGTIVERVRQFNPVHNGTYGSLQIFDHQNVWPIPNRDIIVNSDAVLEQNPDY
ncbi:RagB/SusD family nutrient uptake outer membrane protein [Fulvivirga sp. M361]|uniref:RagB/SusD family nutrient uptake outer membrane protein n=1 Tax=Fulvivirga sp. M361 TaxID=2594266 RepID=UPI00117AB1E5|nr:RagB/SusD family nutrient uptake outer membrane protein [Fulvivirga sp. M361]TRX59231.1 RagB/SusD family nutrient uptake outer membrane protein [Fulvivirga sp. M361]